MKALGRFLTVLLLLGNLVALAALSLHVVRTPGQVAVVAKSQLTLVDTYVDTRGWSATDLKEHAVLVTRIVQSGHGAVLSHITNQTAGASLQQPYADITDALNVPDQLLKAPSGPSAPAQKPAPVPPGEPRKKTIFDSVDQK